MNRIKLKAILISAALCTVCLSARAEGEGAYLGYTPYSVFGLGDLSTGASAYNMTMGGTGIASRNHRYLNAMNPAAVTARDSLAFMSDFSLSEKNKLFRQNNRYSVSESFTLDDFIISFPIYGKSAMMLGLKPFSSTGYRSGYYETDPKVLATVGNVSHTFTGTGSMYQLFAGAGVTVFKNLSLGAEYICYFGNIKKTYAETIEDAAAAGLNLTNTLNLTAHTAKLGLQYEQKLGNNWKLGVGATYRFAATMDGYVTTTITGGEVYTRSVSDTLSHFQNPVRIGDEIGLGISLNFKDKFRAEFDWTRSDWSRSNFDLHEGFSVNEVSGSKIFTSGISQSFRGGIEYIPNPGDIRYYRNLIAYRAGAYFNKEYFSVNGNPVYTRGITLGVTLPVFRWYNGLTLGVELGQRGSLNNDMIRESYMSFSLGVNLFDIWFQQPRYE